ncbi:MAG TPA: ATP-binding protein [Solirubrobacterales bacterium]|jgi:two-component system sensor histidine kinase KdpD|nr:ATP-binding protein [Solirubrobacterales bacterium]
MPAFRLRSKPPSLAFGILTALIVVAASGLVVAALESVAEPGSLGIVFIPGVLLIATVWGLWLGLGTALLSAVVFNFYFLPPLRNFSINARHDIVALLVFVLVAVVSGTLAELARARAVESERRRREADRALREAAELAAERDRMREEAIEAEALRRSDELKTSLLRAVSHDLRTPLTAIIAAGAALDSPSVTEAERHELSDAVVDEGQRLSRLVENLLDVSRLESGAAEPHREPVELGDLLMAARESIGANGERVRLSLDDDLPALSADPTQLERAFANLLENAVVHGEGQPVLVRSRLVGPRLVVRVVDRGPGIPESQRERIFEPFYRAPGARPGSGSGLGLAIARGFIEANGGEVEVESLPGQGSSFVVTFDDVDAVPATAPDGVGG